MATVSQLLALKGRTVHTIDRSATVFEAISRMVERNVGALLALEGMRPVGILTERDYLRKVALHGRASRTTRVEEIMSTELISVGLDTGVEECMSLMTRNHIRHLPVLEGAEIAGIVSIGDIVKFLAGDRLAQIEQLTAYVQRSEGVYTYQA
ncbi:MAG TPA: CBS domain-containing protein [Polyangiaceae bacterium]|jgi:CBS domain-containing protein|nr:CBS domain-containing protein [Polyangiaceae bacterium]